MGHRKIEICLNPSTVQNENYVTFDQKIWPVSDSPSLVVLTPQGKEITLIFLEDKTQIFVEDELGTCDESIYEVING